MNSIKKKFLVRFFLLLSILLGGYAHAHRSLMSHSFGQIPVKSDYSSGVGAVLKSQLQIHKAPSERKRHFFEVDPTEVREVEEDEHDFSSFKKHLTTNKYPASIFSTTLFGDLFSNNRRTSPFCSHLSCNSSGRYLVLQVFRI